MPVEVKNEPPVEKLDIDTAEQAARVLFQLRKDKRDIEKTAKRLTEQLKEFLGSATEWVGRTIILKREVAETYKVDPQYVLTKASAEELAEILQHADIDKGWFEGFVKDRHPGWSSHQYLRKTASVEKLLTEPR